MRSPIPQGPDGYVNCPPPGMATTTPAPIACEAPVFFATTEGQTRRIAERLAAVLREVGLDSQAIAMAQGADAIDWSRVRVALVGASIHIGTHQPAAVSFVESHAAREGSAAGGTDSGSGRKDPPVTGRGAAGGSRSPGSATSRAWVGVRQTRRCLPGAVRACGAHPPPSACQTHTADRMGRTRPARAAQRQAHSQAQGCS